MEDSRDAIEWLRGHAEELGVSSGKICCGGASAGACMATLLASQDPEGRDSMSIPNLLLLEYPPLVKPMTCARAQMPPMLLCMGTKDEFTKIELAEEYVSKVRQLGNECEFHPFEGRHHPIFYYRKPLTPDYDRLLSLMDTFLIRHGYMMAK